MQGFYAVVFGSLDELTANVWNKVKRTHDGYGCVGLMDPRWHPELMERLHGLGESKSTSSSLNQANIDDFVSPLPIHLISMRMTFPQSLVCISSAGRCLLRRTFGQQAL